ncbi:MAG: DUF2779 domain-containing protein [Ferruginibacter sp.]
MRGCQCTKSLWLHKFQPELKDEMSAQKASIFNTGTNVGELARKLFPGGVDASPDTAFDYQQSVAATAGYIAAGSMVIYEAAFQFDGVLAALDILVKKNGRWYGYEVKSSTQVNDQYVEDVALQYYVINNSGVRLQDISLIHMNNKYVRSGELNIKALFTTVSLKDDVVRLQSRILAKAKELKAVISHPNIPQISTGNHCNKPYTCDFYGHCWKDVEEESRYESENINLPEIKAFTRELRYPLYFMDFETYMMGVPEYNGHWPYRQVPFQFSVHLQEKKNGLLQHQEYLAPGNCDPCPHFVESLIASLGSNGSIVVYNQAFENTRLKELKNDYPKYSKQIERIQSRLVDLMVPFSKKYLYLRAMKGSYSIKYVLPALVPDMSYDGLDIANGGDASLAFFNLRYEDDLRKIASIRGSLLKYCELDTLAMVKILQRLYAEVDNKLYKV